MGKTLRYACVLAACLLLPLSASAQTTQVAASDPEAIEAILKGFGIARLEGDKNSDPKIGGRTDGKQYQVFFYGCTVNRDCKSIQFWAYWSKEVPLDRVNEWNRVSRYGKVYVDADNDLVLEFDVNLSHGMAERTMEENADIWTQLVSRVEQQLID